MTESEALFGDLAGKITFEISKSRRRPSFDAFVERELRTMAVVVAHHADQLRWTVQREEPLRHR